MVSMELLNEKVNLETVSSVLPIWCLRTGFLIKQLKKNQSTKLLDSSIVRKEQSLSLKIPFLWRKEKRSRNLKLTSTQSKARHSDAFSKV